MTRLVPPGDKLGAMGRRLTLFALLAGLAACGPIAYVNEVTRRADDAVDAARRAEADKLAPYWWTRANEYLHKARENAARADFQGANRFGRLAAEAAQQAMVDAKDPSKRPIDLTKPAAGEGMAPAKSGDEPAPAKDAPAKDDAKAPAKDAPSPAKTPAKEDPVKTPAKEDPAKAPAKGAIAPAKEAP